jgi:hypothetical protein
MVEVQYVGRLGNQLFTYATARVIAEALHYKLAAPPIAGFGGTYNVVLGATHHEPVEKILRDYFPDVAGIIANRTPRKILVAAYCQKYEYIRDRAADVQRWYRQPPPEKPCHPDAVVMHVRLTDFIGYRWAIDIGYYTAVLDTMFRGRPVVIITDDPTHACLRAFDKYAPTYYRSSPLEDFRCMVAARDLIIGTSTFSWWAAFLSRANVFAPLLQRGYYFRPEYKNEHYVVDDPRYTYIDGVKLFA